MWVSRQAARRERAIWAGLAAMAVVVAVLAFLLIRGGTGLVTAAVLVGLALAIKAVLDRRMPEAERWMRGAVAERAVGNTLEELTAAGWTLLHDLPQRGEGNIDHIASGPTGVYLIETKARRYEEELTKVKRQAAKVHGALVWVTPVICLHTARRRPFRHKGVWIVPRAHLLDWLRAQRNATASPERLSRVPHAL